MERAVAGEFDALSLPDKRLDERGRKLLKGLSQDPSEGPPQVLSSAELEGYYRFVNNERVTLPALLEAHIASTLSRVSGRQRVVVSHDSTDFRYSDEAEREGLGPMDNGGQGFYAHFSMAVGASREALGVVALETWTRKSRVSEKKTQKQRYESPSKESLRWMRAVRETERRISALEGAQVIHVMDREADDYDILCELTQGRHGFVVRACYDRRLAPQGELKTFVRQLDLRCEREAVLSSRSKTRPPKQRKRFPPRNGRVATLTFAAESVVIQRPSKSKAPLAELPINVVHVREPGPPQGCEGVEWILLTQEPIDTVEAILELVDDYRRRWILEEYFKALKTGCAFEKRQHETMRALLNALGIFIPIAWSLLNMRTLSRDPEFSARPATQLFNETQLEILRAESGRKLSRNPSIAEAVLAMARVLGGLLPSNGAPGWQILGRAYEKLLLMEAGWRAAMSRFEAERCDR